MLYPIFGLVILNTIFLSWYTIYSFLFIAAWVSVWTYLSGIFERPRYILLLIALTFWIPFLVYFPEYLGNPLASWSLYYWIPFAFFTIAFGLFIVCYVKGGNDRNSLPV